MSVKTVDLVGKEANVIESVRTTLPRGMYFKIGYECMHSLTSRLLCTLPGRFGLLSEFGRSCNHILGKPGKEACFLPKKRFHQISSKRNEFIQNAYAGETACILTCGPSIKEVCTDEFLDFLSDKLVIAVKQTHDLRPEITDIHLVNTVRLKPYEYPAPTIRISAERAFQDKFREDFPSHINYPIKHDTIVDHDVTKAMMAVNDYAEWTLDRSMERRWGIGVMFEVGLFLPLHLGCRKVLIVGFDMNQDGAYHFYREQENASDLFARPEEFVYARSSIPHYIKLAKERGMDVSQYSPLSDLPIPQLGSLEEVRSWYSA